MIRMHYLSDNWMKCGVENDIKSQQMKTPFTSALKEFVRILNKICISLCKPVYETIRCECVCTCQWLKHISRTFLRLQNWLWTTQEEFLLWHFSYFWKLLKLLVCLAFVKDDIWNVPGSRFDLIPVIIKYYSYLMNYQN